MPTRDLRAILRHFASLPLGDKLKLGCAVGFTIGCGLVAWVVLSIAGKW